MELHLHQRQLDVLESAANEILYGGAAGGGKSFLLRALAVALCYDIKGLQVYLFRRTYPDLVANHMNGYMSFPEMLAPFIATGQVTIVDGECRFSNGSKIHLCHAQHEKDVLKYQGAEIHCCEENELVRMADGTFKRIAEIIIGDFVDTLQGARRVEWVGERELKSCVAAKVFSHGAVTQQIHSETHKILTPSGWVSYVDILNEFLLFSTCESIQNHSFRKCDELSASELRSAKPSHESPYQDSERKFESVQLYQDCQSVLVTSFCKVQQVLENDSVKSLGGNQESNKLSSSFSFPVVLRAPSHNREEAVFSLAFQRGVKPCAQSEYKHEDCQFGCQTSHHLHGEYQSAHLNKPHDAAHKQGDAEERIPKCSPLDDLDIIQKCIPLGQLQYDHPYTGEERTAKEALCLGTCVVTPCGERWTIDLMVEGENHYITESGLVNKNCLLIDELTHFSEYMYRFLRNRVRLGGLPIPDRWKHKLPMILCGANPGGVGHTWVKRAFIDMAEPYAIRAMPDVDGGMMRQYIPARLDDNPTLQKNDPGYLARLSGLGSDDLVRAMRDGDWDIVAGAAFEHLNRDTHMIREFSIPEHWTKFTSIDWGSSKPYAVGWFAVVGETLVLKARDHWPERVIGKGSIVMYRELYGWNGKPDEGSREESWQVSDRMCGVEKERVNYRIGDSAMWAEHDGPSIAERMMQRLRANESPCFVMEKSRKDRQANYQEMRNRIKLSDGENTGFYAMENCFHFWRTVPELQLDERQPEKGPDTDQEDHIWDCVAYAIASRPVVMDKITWTNEQYDIARDLAFQADRGGHKRKGRYG